eukprot:898536-Heterocapsa_arctica.AAC.1
MVQFASPSTQTAPAPTSRLLAVLLELRVELTVFIPPHLRRSLGFCPGLRGNAPRHVSHVSRKGPIGYRLLSRGFALNPSWDEGPTREHSVLQQLGMFLILRSLRPVFRGDSGCTSVGVRPVNLHVSFHVPWCPCWLGRVRLGSGVRDARRIL